jgi:hypothetical protein
MTARAEPSIAVSTVVAHAVGAALDTYTAHPDVDLDVPSGAFLTDLARLGYEVVPSDRPGAVLVDLDGFGEAARRIERLHADARLCQHDGWRGPGNSAARARDAVLGVLAHLLKRSRAELHEHMEAGSLIEEFGDPRIRQGTCVVCGQATSVIEAKHSPRETEVYLICRSALTCQRRP